MGAITPPVGISSYVVSAMAQGATLSDVFRGGNLFVVERDAHVVRRIDARTRVTTTLAGTGEAGSYNFV